MSVASEWAERLARADNLRNIAWSQRPDQSIKVYASGAHLWFSVSDEGWPQIHFGPAGGKAEIVTVAWAEDIEKLQQQARYILDTFSEPA